MNETKLKPTANKTTEWFVCLKFWMYFSPKEIFWHWY
jgi:hypothetical protein